MTLYRKSGIRGNAGWILGDLEFYSDTPITAEDADLRRVFASYQLDENYVPVFSDVLLYAQILYEAHMYKEAAPVCETALAKLSENPYNDARTMKRVATDQAGMAYGMSGDIQKARAMFDKAIAEDPDYPMYYYNPACADEEKNLVDARKHLQEAFKRKANVVPGESMPDPTADDSFLPYRNNKGQRSFSDRLPLQEWCRGFTYHKFGFNFAMNRSSGPLVKKRAYKLEEDLNGRGSEYLHRLPNGCERRIVKRRGSHVVKTHDGAILWHPFAGLR